MIGSRVLGFPFRAGSEKPIMEEAEACYYKENGGDVDPDITLSYIVRAFSLSYNLFAPMCLVS